MSVKGVFGIVFHNDQVLLIRRMDISVWAIPGGGVEKGETPMAATIRELKEESGLDVSIIRLVGSYLPKGPCIEHTHVYLCKIEGGNLIAGDEVHESRFFSLQKIPSSLPPILRDFIDDALKNSPPIERAIMPITPRMVFYFLKHPWISVHFLLRRIYGR